MNAILPVHDVAPMDAPVIVAADVHLSPEQPEVAARFEGWLESLGGRCATLVLLGDVFEGWVGRRQQRDPFARRFLDRLAALSKAGTRLAFQGGNRDFAFDGADGLDVALWPDVVRTRWGERTVVLTHGDLLCSADRRYQRMRRLLRSAPVSLLRTALPWASTTGSRAHGSTRTAPTCSSRGTCTRVSITGSRATGRATSSC